MLYGPSGFYENCSAALQKALINMNLRLDNVLEDISGATGMAIIRAIIGGERDPQALASLRDKRCKKSVKEIEDSLNGFYQERPSGQIAIAKSQFQQSVLA